MSLTGISTDVDVDELLPELVERINELEDEVTQLREENRQKDQAINDIQNKLDDFDSEVKIVNSRINNINKSLDRIEHDILSIDTEIDTLEENMFDKITTDTELELQLSVAERIHLNGWDSVSVNKTKNRDRAMELFSRWTNWSEPIAGGGRRCTYVDLKDKLDVDYKTADRIANHLVELSDGKFKIDSTDKKFIINDPDCKIFWDVDDVVKQ